MSARLRSRVGLWTTLALVVSAAVLGVVVQSQRSARSSTGDAPQHALGPGDSEIEGSPDAPVLVEEFGDYQCPACGLFHRQVGPTIDRLVKDKRIRFAFHPFSFLGDESVAAAAAAECAGDEHKYFAMWNVLYDNQHPENSGAWTTDALVALARQAGAGSGAQQCIRAGTYRPWARRATAAASERGIVGTPTIAVNGQELTDHSAAALVAAVDAATR